MITFGCTGVSTSFLPSGVSSSVRLHNKGVLGTVVNYCQFLLSLPQTPSFNVKNLIAIEVAKETLHQ